VKSFGLTAIVLGVLGIAGSVYWWWEFYRQVGGVTGGRGLPIDCLWQQGGSCGLVESAAGLLTANPYDPRALWVSAVVLIFGFVLSSFSSRRGSR
jgi:hypothetical protein